MPITLDDLRLFRSLRMTDFADGGGRMSGDVVVDGQKNNVFDDLTDFERLAGRTSLRKIFGQVLSEDNDVLLSAYALLDTPPDDPEVEACIFTTGDLATERATAVGNLESTWSVPPAPFVQARAASQNYVLVRVDSVAGLLPAGLVVGVRIGLAADGTMPLVAVATVTALGSTFGGPTYYWRQVFLDRLVPTLPGGAPSDYPHRVYYGIPLFEPVRVYGVATLTDAIDADDTELPVDKVTALVVPWAEAGPYPIGADGIAPAPFEDGGGRVPALSAGDPVLVHHTTVVGPTAVADEDVVDVGRPNLARLRVIGSDGTVHARFDAGAPPPAGVGCTADLAAGTVEFQDVTGYAQPVTIEHRIENLRLIASIAGTDLTLSFGVNRAFPAGARVSSLVRLGDLRSRVVGGFAQQAWTGVWSDARIGGEPLADFNDTVNPIVVTNRGAVGERWAVIFTNATAFRVVGEQVGEVGTGSTGAEFAPVNPATGVPYFSIPAAGWGVGWAAGNVFRFNTAGASAALWSLRCCKPSEPTGDDRVIVEFRGYINT